MVSCMLWQSYSTPSLSQFVLLIQLFFIPAVHVSLVVHCSSLLLYLSFCHSYIDMFALLPRILLGVMMAVRLAPSSAAPTYYTPLSLSEGNEFSALIARGRYHLNTLILG
ncbi:hypothetical protein PENSPDRAFT_58257 [Peniophora sp. CONT]|nr:hypothetical protein PENSPDRAFT_58257 [Peniophora sp. CONT]